MSGDDMRDWMLDELNELEDFEWEFQEPSWVPGPEDDDGSSSPMCPAPPVAWEMPTL